MTRLPGQYEPEHQPGHDAYGRPVISPINPHCAACGQKVDDMHALAAHIRERHANNQPEERPASQN